MDPAGWRSTVESKGGVALTMLSRMPEHAVVRSAKLFESWRRGDPGERVYSFGELQLTADGDLILHTRDSGYWVALMIGEMVQLYHQWYIVASTDVPRLVGDPEQAFEVVRQRLAIGPDEHSIELSQRFTAWLTAQNVPYRYESYDDYGD